MTKTSSEIGPARGRHAQRSARVRSRKTLAASVLMLFAGARVQSILVLAIGVISCEQPQQAGGSSSLRSGRGTSQLVAGGNQLGRLTSYGAGAMRVYLQYDALGRSPQMQHVMDGTTYIFRTAYGYPQAALGLCPAAGCGTMGPIGSVIVSTQFPDGEKVTTAYDAGGAPQAMATARCNDVTAHTDATCATFGATQTIVVKNLRNVRGDTVQVVLGNGTEQDHAYNDSTDLRLASIRSLVSASGVTLQSYGYRFDPAGNLVEVDDLLTSSLSATYTYDSVRWLRSMTSGGAVFAYGYDDIGNLIAKEGVSQTYGGVGHGPHQLASAGGLTYSYDANGNLASRSDGLIISWDANNMPVSARGGAASTPTAKTFFDTGLWRKAQGSNTTYYLPATRMENGLCRKFFGPYAERSTDGALRFYHSDHLSSSALMTDASGAVIHRAAYLPYGGDRSVAGYTPPYTESFAPQYQFTFQEKEHDGTSFYDFGARLYNPATGRWLSPDSSSHDGLNRYAYVRNSPVLLGDPSGRDGDEMDDFGFGFDVVPFVQLENTPMVLPEPDPAGIDFGPRQWNGRIITSITLYACPNTPGACSATNPAFSTHTLTFDTDVVSQLIAESMFESLNERVPPPDGTPGTEGLFHAPGRAELWKHASGTADDIGTAVMLIAQPEFIVGADPIIADYATTVIGNGIRYSGWTDVPRTFARYLDVPAEEWSVERNIEFLPAPNGYTLGTNPFTATGGYANELNWLLTGKWGPTGVNIW